MLTRITLLTLIGAVQSIRIRDGDSNDLPPEMAGSSQYGITDEVEGGDFA